MSGHMVRYQDELCKDQALVERILHKLPAAQTEPEPVIVRVRREDADRGIAHAMALAVRGVQAKVELIEGA